MSESGISDIFGQIISEQGAIQGSVFKLNVTGAVDQFHASVAALSDGGFAAAWQSQGQDDDGYGIVLRQFSSDFTGSTEVIVNDITVGDQTNPTVLGLDSGGFIVGWTDNIHINGGAVYAQRFDGFSIKLGSNVLLNDDGIVNLNNSKDVDFVELEDGSVVAAWDSWDGTRDIFARTLSFDEKTYFGSDVNRINETTSGEQHYAHVAGLTGGKFVAVWGDRSGNDGSAGGIFAQILNAKLEPVGEEFLVNTVTDFWQAKPEISSTSTGDFLVTWHNQGALVGQFFDSNGAKLGEQFSVRSGFSHYADIASDSNGGFWVASNIAQDAIYLKKLSVDGVELTSDIKIDSDVFQSDPSITVLSDQRVLVTWSEVSESGISDIFGQIISEQGAIQGSVFKLNVTGAVDQFHASVAALSDGGFAAAWQSQGQDDDGYGIVLRQFSSDFTGSTEVIVNDITVGDQTNPTVLGLDSGGFIVGWTDNIHINGGAVYAQRFDGFSIKLGSNVLLNDDGIVNLNNSKDVDFVELEDGSVVAAWDSWDGTRDIFARTLSFDEGIVYGSSNSDEFNGNDRMLGGAGNDVYYVDGMSDRVYETTSSLSSNITDAGGTDRIYSLVSQNMDAYNGVKFVEHLTLQGTSNIYGYGNSLNNSITGTTGNNTLKGKNGNDTLRGMDGNDKLYGQAGNDSLYMDAGNDTLDGGAGTDWLYVTGGTNSVVKLAKTTGQNTDYGTDIIKNIENASGGKGVDKFYGTAGNNTLKGNNGNDILQGKNGSDNLYGGAGKDNLQGGNNNDKLYGGSGNDKSYGQAGNDSLYMDAGNDTLDGGSGTDWLYVTGSANSVVNFATTTAQNTGYGKDIIKNIENASGGKGVDKFYGTAGNNTLKGNNGNDILQGKNGSDNLYGGAGDDILDGGAGIDRVYGGKGHDKLYGGNGNDLLTGDAGRDILQGDAGKDTMFGGAGADTFVFKKTADSKATASKADVIEDFQQGLDVIDLSVIDASTVLAGNNIFTFDGTTPIGTSQLGDIYYKQFDKTGTANDYTMVYIDTDNDSGTEMSIKLMGLHNLTADDFIL